MSDTAKNTWSTATIAPKCGTTGKVKRCGECFNGEPPYTLKPTGKDDFQIKARGLQLRMACVLYDRASRE